MVNTHLQHPSGRDPATQALTNRWADLCRADPAGFAVAVRRADHLQREGASRSEAMLQALEGCLGVVPV